MFGKDWTTAHIERVATYTIHLETEMKRVISIRVRSTFQAAASFAKKMGASFLGVGHDEATVLTTEPDHVECLGFAVGNPSGNSIWWEPIG